ncbi:hypothetical protein DJ531_10045, partial [Sulfolobus sp. A20-N-F6]
NRISMNTPVNVKFYANKDVIKYLEDVKDDLMKTLKIVNLEFIVTNDGEEKVEIKVNNSSQSMGV